MDFLWFKCLVPGRELLLRWWETFLDEPRVQLKWPTASPTSPSIPTDQRSQYRAPYTSLFYFWEFRLFGDIRFFFFFLSVSLYIVACTPLQKMTG